MPCAIHGMGSCPYPVAQRQPVLSSLDMREGEEGLTDEDDVVEVAVAEEEDDDKLVEVIPVPDTTPPQPAYKQSAWIRIGPRGQPTKTLVSWSGARETARISLETRSEVWPPPPPSPGRAIHNEPPSPQPVNGALSTAPLPQDPTTATESPPLWSPLRGRMLRRFAHLTKPSRPGHKSGAWDLPHQP
jgi:hypothetical protein